MSYPYTYIDSPFVSQHYKMFCDLGYPQLDINEWPDGEWAILQMWNAPLVPQLTKFNYVLTGLRNIEKSQSFIEKYVELVDITRRAFWELQEDQTLEAEKAAADKEMYFENSALKKLEIIKRTPVLMDRVQKFGMNALGFESMWRHLEPWEKRRMGYVNRQFFAPR
jgi:hypothetical protein